MTSQIDPNPTTTKPLKSFSVSSTSYSSSDKKNSSVLRILIISMALKKCLTVLSSSALFMFSATSKTKYSMEKHSGRVMTDEEPRPLSPDEKGQVLQLIKLIRDSPSEELFKENQEKLKAMTEGLTVRLGNSKNAVLFCSYYEANWESCAFRWVGL